MFAQNASKSTSCFESTAALRICIHPNIRYLHGYRPLPDYHKLHSGADIQDTNSELEEIDPLSFEFRAT